MAIAATAAHGAVFKIGDGASSETFNEIEGIFAGPSGMGIEQIILQGRHHSSDEPIKKTTGHSSNDITCSCYYDSSNTYHQQIITDAEAGTSRNWQLTSTDAGAEVYALTGTISYSLDMDDAGWNVLNFKVHVEGDVTRT